MSLGKIDQIKSDKPFKLPDLIIYAIIVLLAAAVLAVIFTVRDNGALDGIQILSRRVEVFEYDFSKDEYSLFDRTFEKAGVADIEITDGDILTVKITLSGGDYNTVAIDKKARSAYVTEANCRTHDCVSTPAIKDSGGIIYCSLHLLQIVPLNYPQDDGKFII